ncbi:MAG: 2-amino-4-hydroxy-6-hydroxymethyldihydropteridine diphosphokinase [Betaproteobacteria bacterium]|nr:2-amino-4-hydroxy-6-hydroxymethyldihydropteridine diphosphokinase [Betaproteobacteria bacterium]
MAAVRAFIGLGANLGEPEARLRSALQAIGDLPDVRLVRASSFYRSAPVGYSAQPDFINAVAEVETGMPARALLGALLQIESQAGRAREFANAPRTLDLDLLLYGNETIADEGLAVPHPRLHVRAFALAPLAEIAPDAVVPGKGQVRELLAGCGGQRVEKMANS